MAAVDTAKSASGVAFLVAGGFVYEAVAAACSSPQTAEINAHSRAGTLMKWVHLGMLQALALVVLAAMLDEKHRLAILAGGGTVAGLMYAQYRHALKAGLASAAPGTES